MGELATAYVQLVPTATGMSGKISKELGSEAESAGKSAGNQAGQSLGASLGAAVKKAVVALGLGKIVKDALSAGGDLQQSFGGLDTIYGEAAKQAKAFATEAVTAGISANDYAEQAVSFGAALKQAYGGDTYKAMEAANTAILDMADNSAKMGTDIGAIQNAYQGFAKQNYTMLDNLKLGYGGTKTEMERLLADAEKLSGVKYNIDNLGDVYDAIHVIQDELGLTGVAAAEASSTFTGSFAAMQSAATNLLANLSLGEDIQPSLQVLRQTVMTFLEGNLLPMVGNILQAAPDLIEDIGVIIRSMIDRLTQSAPELVSTGVELIGNLVEGFMFEIPYLAESALYFAVTFIEALLNYDWIGAANNLISRLAEDMDIAAKEILGVDGAGVIDALIEGISNTVTSLLDQANTLLQQFGDAITKALPVILDVGVDILTKLVDGIMKSLPGIIHSASEIINTLADYLLTNLPTILDAGIEMLLAVVQGIEQNLPEIVMAAVELVTSLQRTIIQHAPEILKAGIELIAKLIAGLWKEAPNLLVAAFQVVKSAGEEMMNVDWIGLGKDVIKGIAQGLKNAGHELWDALKGLCEDAWRKTKEFFKVGSPSKLFEKEIGEMIPKGMAIGIENDADYVTKAMHEVAVESVSASKAVPYFGDVQSSGSGNAITITNTFEINGMDGDLRERAKEIAKYLDLELRKIKMATA